MAEGPDGEYTFRPDIRFIEHNADTVELRSGVWNASSVMLSDDEAKGLLASVVRGIYERRSRREIASKLGVGENEISSVIQALLAEEVLVSAEQGTRRSLMSTLVARTLGMGKADREPPAYVSLLAPEKFVTLFSAMLSDTERDCLRPVEQALAESLAARDLFLDADGLAQADASEPFEEWRGSAVVTLWPELHPILLGNLNRLAHLTGFTLLPAVVDGPFAIVGPTVVPGLTPCFACAETRVLDAMRDHILYLDYRRALAAGRVHGYPGPIEVNPFVSVLLAFAAWETTNLLSVGTAFTCERLLTLYAPTLEIGFHELQVVPGCPVCSPSPGQEAPLYADLQAYLTSILGPEPPAG